MIHPALVLLSFCLVLAAPGSVLGTTFDLAGDFLLAANPNGAWRYGVETTLGGSFALLPNTTTLGSGMEQRSNSGSGYPLVEHNPTADTLTFGTGVVAPGKVAVHPGPLGEYAVMRFVAPAGGAYGVSALFSAADSGASDTGDGTDVHVLLNGASLFSDSITNTLAGGDTASYGAALTLAAGDILDFEVGFGPSFYTFDTTGLDVHIESRIPSTAVPLPASLRLLGDAVSILSARRFLAAR